jgi:hypothetical protein
MERDQEPRPPQAPDTARAFRPPRHHAAGITLLGLLTLAAAAGVFGDVRGRAAEESGELRLQVDYLLRTRAKIDHTMTVEVTNVGDRPLGRVVVTIDRRYLDAFGALEFTPAAARADRDAVFVELRDVAPGETRLVLVGMRAEALWARTGIVAASTAAAAAAPASPAAAAAAANDAAAADAADAAASAGADAPRADEATATHGSTVRVPVRSFVFP